MVKGKDHTGAKKIRKYNEKWFYLIIMGLFFATVALGGEILIRFLRPYYSPDTVREASLQYLPSIFSRHILKPTNTLVATKPNGQERYFISDRGFRGPSFALQKSEGERRIIVLGGSAVFDLYATDSLEQERRDWPGLLERNLRNRGFNNIQVINAGTPGHASFDSLGRLYSQLWMYKPDVVLFYHGWNDIKYFNKLTPSMPLSSVYRPYDSLANPFMHYQGVWDRLFSYSQLYTRFIRGRYFKWKLHVGKEGVIESQVPQDNYSRFGPDQYRLNVELFVDACRNIKATPILLTQATLITKNNLEEEKKLIGYNYQRLTHQALYTAYEETYDILQSVAQRKQVEIWDLAKQLNGERELFVDHVHTTQLGSERIAKFVAAHLAKTFDGEK